MYEAKKIKLKSPLAFWKHFEGAERMLFYNPIKKQLIMGAEHFAKINSPKQYKDYKFVFSTRYFMNEMKNERWKGFGNCDVAFRYYLVVESESQTLYCAEGKEYVKIADDEIKDQNHIFSIEQSDYRQWESIFTKVQEKIAAQKLRKVVLSREVIVQCESEISILSVVARLMNNNPECYTFAYYKEGRCFLGSTPEILVQKTGKHVTSYALAGTIDRNENLDELQQEKLRNDPKNFIEHKIVLDDIVRKMRKITTEIIIGNTELLELKNLYHIKTQIIAENETQGIERWMELLHPTPAMGGQPTEAALRFLKEQEEHDRGLYASPIGLINSSGDGVYVVGIRSALIEANTMYAYAGCGVVKQSNCGEEYEETNSKLKTILESL